MAASACADKPAAIAELIEARGPIEREPAGGAWQPAQVGARFFRHDAAKTAEGGARLQVANGATIAMQPHTILRFGGGKAGGSKISVELGAIDLTGSGSYGFDLGDVTLSRNGAVRITAKGGGQSSIQLTLGEAQVSTASGTVDLALGADIEIGAAVVTSVPVPVPVDAGAPPDAAEIVAPALEDPGAPGEGVAQLEITGKRAELQAPGETAWKPLEAGANALPPGAKLRIGPGTTARLTASGTALELGGGSRASIGEDLSIAIEVGTARAAATGDGVVRLPGGVLALRGTPRAPAEARL
ncbi:MAG: hypothetical protein ACTHU0_05920, partial [Kofleriaceae bacterium]